MRLNVALRTSMFLAAAGFFLVGAAVAASVLAAVNAPADSPSAAGVVPAVIANTLENAQLSAADLALANGDQDGAAGAAKRAGRPLGLLRMIIGRTEHAEITVSTDTGTRTLLYVRGEITMLSASSVTVTIGDGTRASFAITTTTRVREKGKDIKVTDLSTGDRAMVFGLRNSDGSYTATLIRCVREGARRAPASSPVASPRG
jgi:Domain of unknown function (DUF5666)